MGKYLNVGNSGFAAMIQQTYVDKTGLISFMNSVIGTTEKLICVSRPRRFGKSYSAKMLCAYYDRTCDSAALFENYQIAKEVSFRKYLNHYNVIYLDVSLFISKTKDMKSIVEEMNDAVAEEVSSAYPQVKKDEALSDMLFNVVEATGNKFIMIIDEWDALFREAKNDTKVQREYMNLLRGLFKSSWTDIIFDAVYMTGILPIKKYNTQSAISDFREYNMLDAEPLEEYVGFTEQEVRNLCEDSGLMFEEIQKWYDGYVLGHDVHIYNPKSVMDALKRKRIGNYWTRTETYESLKIYIDLNEDGLKEAIVQMLGGACVKIDVNTFQNDMTTIHSKDDVLTLLIHLGYLAYDIDTKTVSIPNEEVKEEFVRSVAAGKHKEIAKLIKESDLLLQYTLDMDEEAVAEADKKQRLSAGSKGLWQRYSAGRHQL